jgi:acyl carrier protein
MNNINDKLLNILKRNFPRTKLNNNINNLKIGDLKGWDSLKNFNLLLEIEKEFNCKFNSKIFSTLKSIKGIKKFLMLDENKRNN